MMGQSPDGGTAQSGKPVGSLAKGRLAVSPEKVNRWFGKAQIGPSFFLSSSHAANDAMKSAGIMAALFFTAAGSTGTADVPVWAADRRRLRPSSSDFTSRHEPSARSRLWFHHGAPKGGCEETNSLTWPQLLHPHY